MIAHYFNKYHVLHDKYKFSAIFADNLISNAGIDHSVGRCAIHITEFYFIITYRHNENLCFTIEGLHNESGRNESMSHTYPVFIVPMIVSSVKDLEIKMSAETDVDIKIEDKIILMSDPNCIDKIKSYINNTSFSIDNQK